MSTSDKNLLGGKRCILMSERVLDLDETRKIHFGHWPMHGQQNLREYLIWRDGEETYRPADREKLNLASDEFKQLVTEIFGSYLTDGHIKTNLTAQSPFIHFHPLVTVYSTPKLDDAEYEFVMEKLMTYEELLRNFCIKMYDLLGYYSNHWISTGEFCHVWNQTPPETSDPRWLVFCSPHITMGQWFTDAAVLLLHIQEYHRGNKLYFTENFPDLSAA